MENKILFLDFDGVLFDTLREVYLVNRCQYSGASFYDEVDEKNYKLYYKYKFLVYNIWMFYYFNPLIFEGLEEKEIIPSFNRALLNRNKELEEKFCADFLKIREDLIKNHYDFWQKLEKPYKFFFEIKNLYEKEKFKMVVASKKNKSSIVKRFNYYGLSLDENEIFAREILNNYPSKADFFEEYMSLNGYSSALFVDDNINNILPCKKYSNIKTILALWGNTAPDSVGCTEEEAVLKIIDYFKN